MPNETAIVLLIPEVGPNIESIRMAHDPSAALDVPAHMTLLYPWVAAPAQAADLERLSAVVATFAPYQLAFRSLGAFERTLYLAPDDRGETAQLARAIFEAFPDHPPYGGAVREFIPHLTVADNIADLDALRRECEPTLVGALPIETTVRAVTVLASDADGQWHEAHTLSLEALR